MRSIILACLVLGTTMADMWIPHLEHGISSFHDHPDEYQIFRNVKDSGCVGDGVTDDTDCINRAISTGDRCGEGCGSTTLTPALVYFPSGKYLVSSPIISYYYTQLVGDATDVPTLVASRDFSGIGVIDGDPYGSSGDSWYIQTKNFYKQIRNFVIDLTQTPSSSEIHGVHWPMSQATTIYNVQFIMTPNSNHFGIYMEGGSGGFMSNLYFEGGKYGMSVGNQQYLVKNAIFDGCDTAIRMTWAWEWTFKNLQISNTRIGLDLSSSSVGSVVLMDSMFDGVQTAVLLRNVEVPKPEDVSNTLLLDHLLFNNVVDIVADVSGRSELRGLTALQTWGRGSVYVASDTTHRYTQGSISPISKSSNLLDDSGNFFTRDRPQYENLTPDDFISVKDGGARGDGQIDDSDAIQAVVDAADGRVVYFPSGTYIIGKTVLVPPGTRMVGELWPVLMAHGDAFQDEMNPQPMLQIGEPGQSGSVEIVEFLFSAKGAQPGAILVQWNLHEDSQGSAAMWDSHFRVGGSKGSNLQYEDCPRGQEAVPECIGVHTMLHLTPSSSAYLENVWAWTTNYDVDDHVQVRQVSVYTGRGVLIQSTEGPVWLYATESEHNALYQYQLDGASNIFITLVQSETPYYQPSPPAPRPFRPNPAFNDPTYDHCAADDDLCLMAYALRIVDSSNIYIYGSGMYLFFHNYDSSCQANERCQRTMVDIENSSNVNLFNVNTHASVNMVVLDKVQVLASAADNVNDYCRTVNAIFV